MVVISPEVEGREKLRRERKREDIEVDGTEFLISIIIVIVCRHCTSITSYLKRSEFAEALDVLFAALEEGSVGVNFRGPVSLPTTQCGVFSVFLKW